MSKSIKKRDELKKSRLYSSEVSEKVKDDSKHKSNVNKLMNKNKSVELGDGISKIRSSESDRPIINPSLSNPKSVRKKLGTSSSLELNSAVKIPGAGKPIKKQKSIEEKRGVSTIFMSQRSTNTKLQNESSKVTDKSKTATKITAKQPSLSRERRKSRTLSPSEVKVLNKSHHLMAQSVKNEKQSSDNEYEDDFEDYESDFQECSDTEDSQVSEQSDSSSSEVEKPIELISQKPDKSINNFVSEKKYHNNQDEVHDSGHYEIEEARRRALRMDLMSASQSRSSILTNSANSIIFSEDKTSGNKSLPSSADEGFEDGRSGDFVKTESLNVKNPVVQLKKRKLTRGEKLLEMIKLDSVGCTLFECSPIVYEEFIRIHGKVNTRQKSTQSNEDHLNAEIQTDKMEYRNMWTQFPISCRNVLEKSQDIDLFVRESIGVGSDDDPRSTLMNNYLSSPPSYDILKLNEFLYSAGRLMLALLNEKATYDVKHSTDTIKMPFTDSSMKLSIDKVPFLCERSVKMIRYSNVSSKILLTVYEPADDDIETVNEDLFITDCCIGCQWDLAETSEPTKIFYSYNNITACCFHPTNYNIVFAGLEDGSLSLWDLSEDESYYRYINDKEVGISCVLRSPTYNTGGYYLIDDQQSAKIIELIAITKIQLDNNEQLKGKFMPIQLCSLDDRGCCIIWSVLRDFEATSSNSSDLGQSWWGKLRLAKTHVIPLQLKNINPDFLYEFTSIKVDKIDSNHLYVGTNSSRILHLTQIGKSRPSVYTGKVCLEGVTCLEMCPFNQPYFLAGCKDGSLRLHSSTVEKPILELKNLYDSAAIKTIQWSKSKPTIFYVLNCNFKFFIWDLSKNSISPVHKLSLSNGIRISSLELSPSRSDDMINQYIAFGLNNGNVEIHKLNEQFKSSSKDHFLTELKSFLNFISIY